MSDADIFGVGLLGPVFDIGIGKCRKPVQLLRYGCGRELQRGVRCRQTSTRPMYCHGISLLNLDLGDAMRPESEEVRRLLEDLRRGAEKDRKISAREFRKGKIDEAAIKASTERYEDAIVNYYLGLRAYGTAWRRSRRCNRS